MGRERKASAAVVVWLAAMAVTALGQGPPPSADPEIVTDRPDVTESSIVVPKGSLQFENGLTWTSDHGQSALDLSETLARFGISRLTELRFVVPNYQTGLGVALRHPALAISRWA